MLTIIIVISFLDGYNQENSDNNKLFEGNEGKTLKITWSFSNIEFFSN